eukprot:gb/GEZN01004052.1/.p1 GENE.gb/GEZN01004052.1/~~gb/GEZN01004052.1/.p1  ORF type:complete len:511 (-),score=27.50 gb/GEZN01004052.1/:287-1819(-)
MGCAWGNEVGPSEVEAAYTGEFKALGKAGHGVLEHELLLCGRARIDTTDSCEDIAFENNGCKLLPPIGEVSRYLIICTKLVLKTTGAREEFRKYLKQAMPDEVGEVVFWNEVESLRDSGEAGVFRALRIHQQYLHARDPNKKKSWKTRLVASLNAHLSGSSLPGHSPITCHPGLKFGPDPDSIRKELMWAQELVVRMLSQSHLLNFLSSRRGRHLLSTEEESDDLYQNLIEELKIENIPDSHSKWLRRTICLLRYLPVGATIVDVTLPDQPLIYINQAFTAMFQFDIKDAVGKNCRFLQGPNSERKTVDKMKLAIKEWRPLDVGITNYRKDKRSFTNFLALRPVFTARLNQPRRLQLPVRYFCYACKKGCERNSLRFSCPCNNVSYCSDDCMADDHEQHMKVCTGRGECHYYLGLQFEVPETQKSADGTPQVDIVYVDELIGMLPQEIGNPRAEMGVSFGDTSVRTYACASDSESEGTGSYRDSEREIHLQPGQFISVPRSEGKRSSNDV